MLETLDPAFADPVHDAQAVFRRVMDAMARPGRVGHGPWPVRSVGPMPAGLVALALALCDHETPIWLDGPLAGDAQLAGYLRFHTGARVTAAMQTAHFAFSSHGESLPPLDQLAIGTPDYPDRSATLVIAVGELREGRGWRLRGPGVQPGTMLEARPLPADFLAWRADNNALFPRGVDVMLVAGDAMAALPRSTALQSG
jgi:alpha-D-ribose 1-methylphosphonate 5-triphosphate synthase subunit PhnH